MLIGSGVPRNLDGWTAEPKLDGWRARAAITPDGVTLRSRGGHDLAASVPHVRQLAQLGVSVVLDGEIVAGDGRPADFYQLAGALARRGGGTVRVTFVAFDLLWLDGRPLITSPHEQRRSLLCELDLVEHGTPVMPSFQFDDAPLLFAACERVGAEGIVLKEGAGTYRPGVRSSSWRKVKTADWRKHFQLRFAHRTRRP